MGNDELRKHFLIDILFSNDNIPMVYSDVDRSITGSAVPVNGSLKLLATKKEMAAEYFLERREIGIINIGGDGKIKADGIEYGMVYKDGLYLGRGIREVEFFSVNKVAPAKFFFVSFPAHGTYPSAHTPFSQVEKAHLGNEQGANKRTINKYIHPNGIKSCQLVMGLTELEDGSVWNTMPPHTHMRRSEIYMYFNLPEDAAVIHLLGEPSESKHLVMRSGQATISPSWSIHAGCGTRNYSFIWAMGGENQAFDDMDFVELKNLG
jgi:4-deoxy-L-threo-5-hexosulose-uronate ketol-isomerase